MTDENPFPSPVSSAGPATNAVQVGMSGQWDMRTDLDPQRLAIAMWDYAYLGRHRPGQSMADYSAVLAGLKERGYNCVRIDPFPQLPGYLDDPSKVYRFPDQGQPYIPWGWNDGFEMKAGGTVVEFMEEVQRQGLRIILSAWWLVDGMPEESVKVTSLKQGTELFAALLEKWKSRFGFEGIAYVDLCNELPYFIHGFLDEAKSRVNLDWGSGQAFTNEQVGWLANEINPSLANLQRAFPELLFTVSMHGDTRWLQVPVDCDCLDIHFYGTADQRWNARTRFNEFSKTFFTDRSWHAEFSDRWLKSKPAWPLFRARQRGLMSAFANWSCQRGMPLTTSEGWSAWYADNTPDYDYSPLIAWSEWALEDALEYKFWGWTPHSYIQPQYGRLWDDLAWHQAMTERFLKG